MGLTSNPVLVLAIASAVLLFVATVWLWPRLSGRSWRAVLGRIALLLATQLALFASVGLAANNSFGFYASWADLFGQEQEQGVVVEHDNRGAQQALKVTGRQSVDVRGGNRPQVGGQIQHVEISGQRSQIASPAYVYLPPEYFQRRYQDRKFPVAVVLTGYPGTAKALITGLNYPETAHAEVTAGAMQPTVLVMLRPTVAPPRDTECVDVPGGPQTETFFAKDLPGAVSGHYRVGTEARSWGVIGNSTGGYCALKLGMSHPGVYSASAGLSANYEAADDPTTGDLFQGDEQARQRADLFWRLKYAPPASGSYLVTSSKQGEGNYRDTQRFIEQVRSPAKVASITLKGGGHNFNTWRREIPAALQWLSGKLSVR